MAAKLRWGEIDEDDGGDVDFLLPPRVIEGPDENGIKKTIEYKFDDDGNKVKVTTTTRVYKLGKARVSKKATERRHNWAKFGDAVQDNIGSRLTIVSTEEILLERPRAPGSMEEPTISDNLDGVQPGAVLMLCRTCNKKGDHWTSKCPYKDLAQAQPTETFVDGPSTTCYVPPSLRGGGTKRKDEMNSVRVSNLSEDTSKSDVEELFRNFGPVSRVYVAMDEKSGRSRGFGFVNFVNREDAEKAINKLNGYGYDHLILTVEWATPRPN